LKEKIERFSKGDFEYEQPFICLSEEEIRITVEAGKIWEGCFTVNNNKGISMQGWVYSSNRLLQIAEPAFRGEQITVCYTFQAAYLKAGEDLQGEISVISDCGEQTIPFSVRVEQAYVMTSLGKIKDLFQFANLAQADWSEAKKVFRMEEFERIFLSNEERYRYLYHNLIKSSSTSQALEEFLITVRKKSMLRLEIDRTRVEYTASQEKISDKVVLTKNHWGYAEIRVSTDAPFLHLEQKLLWADRFTGNTHPISYTIDPKKLRPGINYGKILIRCVYQTITVDVICRYPKTGAGGAEHHRRGKLEAGFIDNYLSFRLNRIGLEQYIGEMLSLLGELPGQVESQTQRLIKVHLAIVSEKRKSAKELLDRLRKAEVPREGSPVLEYCAHLYLECLYSKEEETIREAVGKIQHYYENGYRDWQILWFLLNLDSSYSKFPGNKLADIREQYELGCCSPILYYEAVCILNQEPVLLRELQNFEIQVLNYGIKNFMVSKELAQQFIYLGGKRKTFHPVLFRCLTRLYDEYGDNETLSAICCLLIKGMKKEEKYFEWYRLGVEAQLRITELYEYYMYSISCDRKEAISQPVLLYFIYNSSLNDRKKAYLYANIIKYRDRHEPVYRSYLKRMEVFAAEMLKSHQISNDLAVLYRELFTRNTLGAQLCGHLPYVMYRQEFYCENPKIETIRVLHKELQTDQSHTLINGRAQIDIFTDNAEILLVDGEGKRYLESIDYSVTPYLKPEDYEAHCLEYGGPPMLLLHLFNRYQNHRIMNEAASALRKQVLLIEGLTGEYATDCHQALIEYYYENYNDELLEYYLNQIDLHCLGPSDRAKYMEFMVVRKLYDRALTALEVFGFEGITINRLVKLCSGWMLAPEADRRNELMVRLCHHVYTHGKYDESVLKYLLQYYEGSEKEMLKLWRAARSFELEAHLLEERLLIRMLYTQSDNPDSFRVFGQYYREVSNHTLVRAYLTFHAYRYLVQERELPQELFPIMKRELNYEENEVCLLAWLKNNVHNKELTGSELGFVEYQLDRLEKKEIILPFFAGYGDRVILPQKLQDKCFITYVADPRSRVYIHYRLMKQEDQEFMIQRMPNVFLGIHVKEFVLFYHETVEYYITQEYEGQETATESFYAQYECDPLMTDDTRYNQISLMLMAKELGDENALLEMMENYIRREYLAATCFSQLD
jgi:hypothetical protein